MKVTLFATFVALLLAGCGGVEKSGSDDNESALAPPVADPVKVPVVDPPKVPVVDPPKVPFADKWTEWEANATPYGGLEALAKIKEAKESGSTELDLSKSKITDITPLAGLTDLKRLDLSDSPITDITPLAELTNLELLVLSEIPITDITPLAGLTKLRGLNLINNPIPDDQKEMLKKALPNCQIHF